MHLIAGFIDINQQFSIVGANASGTNAAGTHTRTRLPSP
jgi:hypothetical protein